MCIVWYFWQSSWYQYVPIKVGTELEFHQTKYLHQYIHKHKSIGGSRAQASPFRIFMQPSENKHGEGNFLHLGNGGPARLGRSILFDR